MPITASEKYRGRSTSGRSGEIIYIVRGTDDDSAARIFVEASAPSSHDGKPLDDVRVEQVGAEVWYATATYQEPTVGGAADGEPLFTFEIGGGSQHITQSLEIIEAGAPAGMTVPLMYGAIGVTRDGVEGVDIHAPLYAFSETHIIADALMTTAYKAAIYNLCARTNESTFKGLAAGEALFLGATGSKRGRGDWEIAFRFAGSPNRTNITIGDFVIANKKGWEYLWVLYEDDVDDAAHFLIKKPRAAYVERVYESGDFATLDIGT